MSENDNRLKPLPLAKIPPVDDLLPEDDAGKSIAGSVEYEESVALEHKYSLTLRQMITDRDQTIADLKGQIKNLSAQMETLSFDNKKLSSENGKISGLEYQNCNLFFE
ncbi:MAG: hypothetical protein LBQ12_08105 [Deltaproteobacteria bacterium]|jgi:hypothetical protein|nr:hypothetical protein [Deltaproteobacteria bacterium]